MVWYAWVAIVLYVLGPICTIALIGEKKSSPVYTPKEALISLISSAFFITVIVLLAT